MHIGHYLVCYDITDPRRLQRVFRASRRFGTPFQYSVVYFCGNEHQLALFLGALEELIDPMSDDIRAYRIRSLKQITTLGQSIQPDGIVW